MKRILIFIGLKFIEIAPWPLLFWFGYWVSPKTPESWDFFILIFLGILLLAFFSIVGYVVVVSVIWPWLKENWERAGEIANR